jgi:hypothetical protein
MIQKRNFIIFHYDGSEERLSKEASLRPRESQMTVLVAKDLGTKPNDGLYGIGPWHEGKCISYHL